MSRILGNSALPPEHDFRNWELFRTLSRGVRNNNPGNLRITSIPWRGKVNVSENTDGAFEQFTDVSWGIRALVKDVVGDIQEGKSTIRQLISEFAPPSENDTESYIQNVAAWVNLSPNQPLPLDRTTLRRLVRAIIQHENGAESAAFITDQMIDAGIDKAEVDLVKTLGIGAGVLFIGLLLIYFITKKQHQ
jgi:hypothetical protein